MPQKDKKSKRKKIQEEQQANPLSVELSVETGTQDLTTGAHTVQGKSVYEDNERILIDVDFERSRTYTNEIHTIIGENNIIINSDRKNILRANLDAIEYRLEKLSSYESLTPEKVKEREDLLKTQFLMMSQLEKEDELKSSSTIIDDNVSYENITVINMQNRTSVIVEPPKKHLDLASLQEFYNNNGSNSAKTYQYLLDHINQYKNEPEVLQQTISALLGDMVEHYDYGKHYTAPASNITDQLDKILNLGEEEQLKGLMCQSIHFTLMKALNDCGIEAVTIGGGSRTNSDGLVNENHSTLIYRNSKGEYVSCNYGNFKVIQANNILDATKEVYKNLTDNNLMTNGTIVIQDEKHMYQSFALENVSAWGKVIADNILFSKVGLPPIADHDEITGSYSDKSGNKTIDINVVLGSPDQSKMQSFALQGLLTGESDIAKSAKSIGGKYQAVFSKNLSDKTKLFFDNTAIISNTTLYNVNNTVNNIVITPQVQVDDNILQQSAQEAVKFNDGIEYYNGTPVVRNSRVIRSEDAVTSDNLKAEYNIAGVHVNENLPENMIKIQTFEQITLNTIKIETQTTVTDVKVRPKEDEPEKPQADPKPAEIKTNLTTGMDIAKVGITTEITNTPNIKVDGTTQATLNANGTLGNGAGGFVEGIVEQGIKTQVKPVDDLTITSDVSSGIVLTGVDINNYNGLAIQSGFKGFARVDMNWQPSKNLDLSANASGGIFTDPASTSSTYSFGMETAFNLGNKKTSPSLFMNWQYTGSKSNIHLGGFDENIKSENSLRLQTGIKKHNTKVSFTYSKFNDLIHPNKSGNSWMATWSQNF